MANGLAVVRLALVALAWCSWFVLLVGLGLVQDKCSAAWAVWNDNYVVAIGYDMTRCSRVLSYWWWLLWLEFFTLGAYTALAGSRHIHRYLPILVGMLAISTVPLMQVGNTTLAIVEGPNENLLSGDTKSYFQAVSAGAILLVIFNFFMLFALMGSEQDEHRSVEMNQRSAVPTYATGEVPATKV